MVFAGGATDSYRDSGLAKPKDGGRERESKSERRRGEVDGGVVKWTVPPFTQVLAEHQKQNRASEATLYAGGLLQTPSRQCFPLSAAVHWLAS